MDLLNTINEYWAIILALVGVTGAFIRMEIAIKQLKAKDSDIEKDVSNIQRELKENNIAFTEIKVAIQAIQTSLEFIKNQLK
jgi:hypothetical protein